MHSSQKRSKPTIMEKLTLRNTVRRLGAAKLTALIGIERLEAIHAIMQSKVTENQLADILIERYGTQIFAHKEIRRIILRSFPREVLAYLAHENESANLTEKDLAKLESEKWSRTSKFTERFLFIFGLGIEYLPPVKHQIPSQDILETDTFLFPFQKRVKDKFIKSLIAGIKRILLHLPTGAGKTRTSIEGLIDFWRSQGNSSEYMIWLTDSEELCTQGEETFTNLWRMRGDRPINLIRLWGSHKIEALPQNGGLIIASLQKLHRMRTSATNAEFRLINEINRRARLIVVDEAHKSIAPTYKATIEYLCDLDKTILVGLTATPGRTDENQIVELVRFYGNNKITLTNENEDEVEDPIAYLQEHQYLSNIIRKRIPTDITIDLTPDERKSVSEFFEIPPRVLIELSKNDQRNALIIREVAKLQENDHQTILFACSVEHAHLITELLMMRGIPARCIDGETPSYDRSKNIKDFKNGKIRILVNYGVLTTGFDAPNTDAVMITRPTGSLVLYSQMIGRGIRGPKMGGTTDCILIDMEDNLLGYPSERLAFKFFDSHWSTS